MAIGAGRCHRDGVGAGSPESIKKKDADLESCTDTAKSATGDAIQWSGHNLDQYSAAHGCFVD